MDASGGGNMGIFTHNAQTLGFPVQDIVVVEGMSSSITPGQLCSKVGGARQTAWVVMLVFLRVHA